jgi:DNA repair protein RadD
MNLRPYQREAIDAAWDWMRGNPGNPCIVLPTGSGKTVVMAEMIREALTEWPGTRILVLAHVRELVRQNAEKLEAYWPEGRDRIGIHSAGLRRRDRFEPVIFASIQSVVGKALRLGRFDLVLVDEAHRIPLHSEGQYRAFLEECRQINPHLRVCGLTATPYRLGGGQVCVPDGVLNAIAYESNVGDLIRDGYLCRLVSKSGATKADISKVHVRQGEYVAKELEAAVNTDDVVEAACDEMVQLCSDRKAWIVFCAGVAHAEHVTEALTRRGVACAMVEGKTPVRDRDARIGKFQAGQLRAMVNINVLSEGFDAQHIDAVVMLRPTKSAGLYYQQVGRGLRLHPAKENCLVLDFAGNVFEHGPIDAIVPPRKPGERASRGAPVWTCPECQTLVPIQQRECPECGYAHPEPEPAKPPHFGTAFDMPILSDGRGPKWLPVDQVHYRRHEGKSGVPSMKVSYQCGLRTFHEWVCVEHTGFARSKAAAWWNMRSTLPTPRTVDEAVAESRHSLPTPKRILVRESGKYPEIINHDFAHDLRSQTPDSRDVARVGFRS